MTQPGDPSLPSGSRNVVFVNGRSSISPEMAIRLDKAFGGGADTWHRLQAAYDLSRALERAHQIEVEGLSTVM